MLTILLFSVILMVCVAESATRYDPYIKQETPFKISSGTISYYDVGKDTVCISTNDEVKECWVENIQQNSLSVWWGFEQNVSTVTTAGFSSTRNGGEVQVDDMIIFEKYYGDIYLVNDDLNQSSTTIRVYMWKNTK